MEIIVIKFVHRSTIECLLTVEKLSFLIHERVQLLSNELISGIMYSLTFPRIEDSVSKNGFFEFYNMSTFLIKAE